MGEGDFSQEQGARRESIEIHDSTRNAAIGKKRRAFSTYATTGSLFLKILKIPIRQIKIFRTLAIFDQPPHRDHIRVFESLLLEKLLTLRANLVRKQGDAQKSLLLRVIDHVIE